MSAHSFSVRPILFAGPMVLANRAGRKTQTRRVVNRITGIGPVSSFQPSDTPGYDWIMRDRRMLWNDLRHADVLSRCPYGQPGDRLWVRETWAHDAPSLEACRKRLEDALAGGISYGPYYRADAIHENFGLRWRPAIHMPRWASRNTYEIVEVRLQRIQDITPKDVAAEGLVRVRKVFGNTWKWGLPDRNGWPGTDDHGWPWSEWCADPITAYLKLWDRINAARGYGSGKNPMTWAITYRDVTAQALVAA